MNEIKLGYEIPSGREIMVPLSHIIVCGVTQLSGKTTTLEALLKRSGKKSIVFKTKIGERSFTEGQETAPFFKDRSDYEFVRSLIEAYAKEKLHLEKGTLMELCKGSASLTDIKIKVDNVIANPKTRGLQKEIFTRLQHYLDSLIPQVKYANLSSTLNLHNGINIMNLERFSEEVQSLIIQSCLDEVLKNHTDIIIVIPEAWKFIPQKYNNPCKRSVESFIRQGASNNNFIWIDSQDMAGVDKIPLKQISTWILGVQVERNEVKHTLDQIALPPKSKPQIMEVMKLKTGQFFLSSYAGVRKVYVQPAWVDDLMAQTVAMGGIPIEDLKPPEIKVVAEIESKLFSQTRSFDSAIKNFEITLDKALGLVNRVISSAEKASIARDEALRLECEDLKKQIYDTRSSLADQITNQKVNTVNTDRIVEMVLARIPAGSGPAIFRVAPLEMIKKGFLEDAKNHILAAIGKLDDEQRKILRFVESQNGPCNLTHIIDKGLLLTATSGGTRDRIAQKIRIMATLQIVRNEKVGKNVFTHPNLRMMIKAYLEPHGSTDAEIQQVYDHTMAGLIKNGS